MLGRMKKLKGALSIASNSYGVATGYGQQVQVLIDRLLRSGMKVANLSNYGLEGRVEKGVTPFGKFDHYPKGFKAYSDDVIPVWHEHFKAKHPDLPSALLTLYDVWVYKDLEIEDEILAYVPMDHITSPPRVIEVLQKKNITPITMAPHGKRLLDQVGIDNVYIPHSVDTSVMKPTHTLDGQPTRKLLQVPDDAFLVSMVAANKANGVVSRKGIAEALMAFSMFAQEHPDAYLYLHMEPSNAFGGFRIPHLLRAVGLSDERVRIANPHELRTGYPTKDLAAIYTASDVLLAPSYGEGFGVPIIEAAACGTRQVTSSWTATADIASPDSFLIEGQPFWDESQQAWYKIPLIGSIVPALEQAYQMPREQSEESLEWAQQFDADRVWAQSWLPFFEERFG